MSETVQQSPPNYLLERIIPLLGTEGLAVIVPDTGTWFEGSRTAEHDGAAYLLNRLLPRNGKVIRLNARRLQQVCGKCLDVRIREKLIGAGVITLEHKHLAGVRSRGYRVSIPPHVPYVYYTPQSKPARKRWAKHFTSLADRLHSDDAQAQVMSLRDASVQIDRLRCEELCSESETSTAVMALRYLNRILLGRWRGTQDDNGRLYTPYTGMPKRFRSCLQFDGEGVCELDTASCTPLLFGAMMQLLGESPDTRYMEDCCGGRLYASVRALMRPDSEVKNLKSTVLASLSASGRKPLWPQAAEVWSAMRVLYPKLTLWVDTNRGGFAEFGNLPVMAMKAEAEIMLSVAAQAAKQGLTCATIHDAVLCPRSASEELSEMIRGAFQKNLGLTPTVWSKA